MGDYNWAEIIKGTRALNYSLRSFEGVSGVSHKGISALSKAIVVLDSFNHEDKKEHRLGRTISLESKSIEMFRPEIVESLGIAKIRPTFVYGLIKEMRVSHPVSNAKMYQFEFDLAQRKVSYFGMDAIDYVREIHTDGERLFDVFEANGWKFTEQQ